VPLRLRGTQVPDGQRPAKLAPIFRDDDELAPSTDLGAALKNALAKSRYLIVICSPRSAASSWVQEEIDTFKALGRGDRILCLIIDGEPNAGSGSRSPECFPPGLRSVRDGSEPCRPMPFAADVRRGRSTRERAFIKLVAGLLAVNFDMLWRRERRRSLRRWAARTAASLALAVVVSLTYLAIADHGLAIPGGQPMRALLDRHDASLFRPARSQAEILTAAAKARAAISTRIQREWREGKWLYENPTRVMGPQLAVSPWVSSQAASAVIRAAGPSIKNLNDFWAVLDTPFADGLPIEVDGKKLGWLVGDTDHPRAEPALWTVTALAAALRHASELPDEFVERLRARLNYAQEITDIYHPVEGGGWNLVPLQRNPREHATYTAALALLALLELREAGLGWHGDEQRLDTMLRATAAWLIGQFDANGDVPGWRTHLNETGAADTGEVADGLTLQIYAELLHAESAAGIALPSQILHAIPKHLDRLVGRPPNYANSLSIISRSFTNFDRKLTTRTVIVSFLWYPWAIEVASRWIERLARATAAAEDRVSARRALGYLMIDLGAQILPAAADGETPTFVASEILYALAGVGPKAFSPVARPG